MMYRNTLALHAEQTKFLETISVVEQLPVIEL